MATPLTFNGVQEDWTVHDSARFKTKIQGEQKNKHNFEGKKTYARVNMYKYIQAFMQLQYAAVSYQWHYYYH